MLREVEPKEIIESGVTRTDVFITLDYYNDNKDRCKLKVYSNKSGSYLRLYEYSKSNWKYNLTKEIKL